MFLIVELIFMVILSMVLYMIYRDEHLSGKRTIPHAIVEEYWKGKERRQHVRFEKRLEVSYTVERKPHLDANSITVDISEGGMKLLMSEKLSQGTILDLKIDIPGSKEEAEAEAEVVWAEDAKQKAGSDERKFYAGVKFIGIKESNGESLIKYIHSIAALSSK